MYAKILTCLLHDGHKGLGITLDQSVVRLRSLHRSQIALCSYGFPQGWRCSNFAAFDTDVAQIAGVENQEIGY